MGIGMGGSVGTAKSISADIVVFLIIVLSMFYVSKRITEVYKSEGLHFTFYQNLYEPAIRVACGYEFGAEKHRRDLPQKVRDFLNVKADTLSCLNLNDYKIYNNNPPSRVWYYMLLFVGLIWSLFGISWSIVEQLGYVFVGLAAGIYYLIYRLFAPTILSAPLAILTAIPSIPYVLYLRDMSKFPFIVAIMFLVLLFLARRLTAGWLTLLSVLAGVIVGVGYGFRPDIIITIPIILVGIVYAASYEPGRYMKNVLAPLAVFLVAFLVVASPINNTDAEQSGCHSHFAILGLAEQFTKALNIPKKNYQWVLYFADNKVAELIYAYKYRLFGEYERGFCTFEYNLYGVRYIFDVLYRFPYDMIERGVRSLQGVLVSGINGQINIDTLRPTGIPFIHNHILTITFWIKAAWIAIFAFLLYANRILFVVAAFIFIYVGFYPAIQFHYRHYFYLSFYSFLPFAILIGQAGRVMGGILSGSSPGWLPTAWRGSEANGWKLEPIQKSMSTLRSRANQVLRGVRCALTTGQLRQSMRELGPWVVHILRPAQSGPIFVRIQHSIRAQGSQAFRALRRVPALIDENHDKLASGLRRGAFYIAPLALLFIILASVIGLLYLWQGYQTEKLFGAYLNASRTEARITRLDANRYQIAWPFDETSKVDRFDHFLRVDFGGASCPPGDYKIVTKQLGRTDNPIQVYKKEESWSHDGTESFVSVFRPFYYRKEIGERLFLELRKTPRKCLKGVFWVNSDDLPKLWMYVVLKQAAGWKGQ